MQTDIVSRTQVNSTQLWVLLLGQILFLVWLLVLKKVQVGTLLRTGVMLVVRQGLLLTACKCDFSTHNHVHNKDCFCMYFCWDVLRIADGSASEKKVRTIRRLVRGTTMSGLHPDTCLVSVFLPVGNTCFTCTNQTAVHTSRMLLGAILNPNQASAYETATVHP